MVRLLHQFAQSAGLISTLLSMESDEATSPGWPLYVLSNADEIVGYYGIDTCERPTHIANWWTGLCLKLVHQIQALHKQGQMKPTTAGTCLL
jgi:hypothetical protein